MANTISKKAKNAARRDYMASPQRLVNQQKAFHKHKRVMITILNPEYEPKSELNPAGTETNRKYIRVTAEEAGWKRPKKASSYES